MSDKKPTEIPGISESDLADLVAGARMACGGGNDMIARIFAEADRIRALEEARGVKTVTE